MGHVAHTWGVKTWVGIEEGKEAEFDPHPEITALDTYADDEKYVANTPNHYKNSDMVFHFDGPHAGDVDHAVWSVPS